MVSRLFRAPVRLTLKLDKKAYRPGEQIEVRVTIIINKDTRIEEGYVEFTCKGMLSKRLFAFASGVYDDSVAGLYVVLLRGRSAFASRSTIRRGVLQTYKAALPLPDNVPIGQGNTRVMWEVRAVFRRKGARNVARTAEILVQWPATSPASK